MDVRSVLIIDNDREIVDLLAFYFEEHGYLVDTAIDGHTGVALAQLRKPDVVICDVIMDRMHGFEVVQKLRARPELANTLIIHVESRGKGAGATFTVALPVLAMRAAPLSATDRRIGASAPVGALEGFRVMIVDDQADARELISVVLRQSGAEVRLAASVSEALEILAAEDALIEAVRMRERERGGMAIRAVALTAHTGREVRERALAAGFDAHATKPVDPQDLIALLATTRP